MHHHSRSPSGAYIHLPFCARRCGYCNFTVLAQRDDLIPGYLDALEKELSQLKTPRPVRTLYCGGGTPTHLPTSQLCRMLELVRQWHPLVGDYEFTVEANPVDVNPEKVDLLFRFGVNRLSIGGQSFHQPKLECLERDHTPGQFEQAVQLAQTRFRSVSMDLIFGAPQESLEIWRKDLHRAVSLAPSHLSTYGLTYEKGTTFWSRRRKGCLKPLDEEIERRMYELAMDELSAAGYEHYEVSSFARPGHRCRHNETYWSGEAYFAAGAGAARYIGGRREVNHRSVSAYIQRISSGRSPVAESEQLAPAEAARELLVLSLRKREGVDSQWFHRRTGFGVDELAADAIDQFIRQGWMERSASGIRLTREGILISDSLWPHLLNAPDRPELS